jgi:hypothetical protein
MTCSLAKAHLAAIERTFRHLTKRPNPDRCSACQLDPILHSSKVTPISDRLVDDRLFGTGPLKRYYSSHRIILDGINALTSIDYRRCKRSAFAGSTPATLAILNLIPIAR